MSDFKNPVTIQREKTVDIVLPALTDMPVELSDSGPGAGPDAVLPYSVGGRVGAMFWKVYPEGTDLSPEAVDGDRHLAAMAALAAEGRALPAPPEVIEAIDLVRKFFATAAHAEMSK